MVQSFVWIVVEVTVNDQTNFSIHICRLFITFPEILDRGFINAVGKVAVSVEHIPVLGEGVVISNELSTISEDGVFTADPGQILFEPHVLDALDAELALIVDFKKVVECFYFASFAALSTTEAKPIQADPVVDVFF